VNFIGKQIQEESADAINSLWLIRRSRVTHSTWRHKLSHV